MGVARDSACRYDPDSHGAEDPLITRGSVQRFVLRIGPNKGKVERALGIAALKSYAEENQEKLLQAQQIAKVANAKLSRAAA